MLRLKGDSKNVKHENNSAAASVHLVATKAALAASHSQNKVPKV